VKCFSGGRGWSPILVKEGGGSLRIAAPVWVLRLGDGPDGRREESGVGGEDVRGVVHWRALTEEGDGGRRGDLPFHRSKALP